MAARSPVRLYRFAQLKAYFEKGYSLTHYIFKVIAVFGLTSGELLSTMIAVGAYPFFCFYLGWASYKYGLITAEKEVSNNFNLFVKQMREAQAH